MASPRTAAPPTSTASDSFWPVLLCWLAVALDGFDLVVLGAVIPTLSKTGDLGFTDASLTTASRSAWWASASAPSPSAR